MPKLFISLIACLFTLAIIHLNASYTQADDDDRLPPCGNGIIQTDFTPLYHDSDKATFTIDVGKNKEAGVSKWKVEFICGRHPTKDATVDNNDNTISTTVANGPTACEFSLEDNGDHRAKVKAIINGQERDYCIGRYQITNANNRCQLDINPKDGITLSSKITLSGDNLTKNGHFLVFIDDKKTDYIPNTPSFSGFEIPPSFLTQGKHKVDIREQFIFPVGANRGLFGTPLCPREFTVGTADRSGSVTPSGSVNRPPGLAAPLTTTHGTTGTCPAAAGGCSCDIVLGSTRYQGIATAVGCIPTQPVGLIRAFLGLLLGIGGGIAFLVMVLGVFQMLTSAGNPDTLKQGTERLTSAIIGLLFIIFSLLLLQIIGVGILNIPGFS